MGRAHLRAPSFLPALIEQVRVERPSLRQLLGFIPPDRSIRTGLDQLLLAPGFFRNDDDDAIGALDDRPVAGSLDAGRVVAVIASDRKIADLDHRKLALLALDDVDPAVSAIGHFRRVPWIFVAVIFIVARKRAHVAVEALRHVDDKIPFFHGATPVAGRSSPEPSHSSTCARQELAAVPLVLAAIDLFGVSWLMQPPRSTEYPGSPIGSYTAEAE